MLCKKRRTISDFALCLIVIYMQILLVGKLKIIDPSTVEGVKRFSELKLDGSIQTINDTLGSNL